LYRVPEAGTHWFRTYYAYYIEKLKLTTSTYDPCLLYNANVIVALQTNNTLFLGTNDYTVTEDTKLRKANYLATPVEELLAKKSLVFNRGMISQEQSAIRLSQEKQYIKIKLVKGNDNDLKSMYI
jgi:hypothetical protein